MYFIIALVIITSLVLFIQKVVMKGRMERGLGRKVSDEELTSLNAWMKVEAAEEASRGVSVVSQNNAPAPSAYTPQPTIASPAYTSAPQPMPQQYPVQQQYPQQQQPQSQSFAPQRYSTPQAYVIVAPMQSQREYTLSSSSFGSFLKFLLKITIIGRFINADTAGTQYLITVDGREYAVSMQTYYQLRPGQMVEVHLEPQSGRVLGIYPTKASKGNPVGTASNLHAPPVFVQTNAYAGAPFDPALAAARRKRKIRTLLIGLLAVAAISIGSYFYFRDPKPPVDAFPKQVGRFKQSDLFGVSYDAYGNVGNGKEFSAYYDAGSGKDSQEITYKVWVFPSSDEAQRALPNVKKETRITQDRVMKEDGTRVVTITYAPGRPYSGATTVTWVDGTRVMEAHGPNQQAVYEFEGLLRNRPPAELIPDPPDVVANRNLYIFDKGGIQFMIPTGWKAEVNKDGNTGDVFIYGPGSQVIPLLDFIPVQVSIVSFDDFTRKISSGVGEKLGGEVKPTGSPVHDTINGIDHTTQSFLVHTKDADYQVRLDLLNVGGKRLGIIGLSNTKVLTPEVKEGVSNLIMSIKKIE